MKKSIALLLLCQNLFSSPLSTEEVTILETKLVKARASEAQEKALIAQATKRLLQAQKIISDEAAQHLKFSSHTELGYTSTAGNTDTKTASLDTDAKLTLREHSLNFDIDYIYGEEQSLENRNKFSTEVNYDGKFSKHFALNYLFGYKDDQFSGFNYQLYTGPGIKYIAVNTTIHILNFQGNVLYSQDNVADTSLLNGQTDQYASLLVKIDYTWNFTDSIKLFQDLSYRTDILQTDNFFVNSKTGITSKLNSTFSVGINYKFDYVNVPPIGFQTTDETLSIVLGMNY